MTTLSEVYGVYTQTRKLLNKINIQDENSHKVIKALYTVLRNFESAMAYLPIEDVSDREIKLFLLKESIMLAAEDGNNGIDFNKLSEFQREQVAIVLQL